MNKLDGIQLIQKIRNGKVKDGSKIKVFYDDGMFDESYVTVIEYKNNDIWAPSTFKVSMLYDKYYSFEIIEDNDKSENNNGNQNEYRNVGKFIGQTYKELVEGFIEGWNSIEEKSDEK